jgi:hypothetical protein
VIGARHTLGLPLVYFCGSAPLEEFSRFLGADVPWAETTDPNAASHLVASHHAESFATFLRVVREHHVTLFYAGEAEAPDFNLFDFAVGFDELEFPDRYVRLHPATRFENWMRVAKSLELSVSPPTITEREFFCDFIYSNRYGHEMRQKLFHALNSQEPVHSWGRYLNNTARKEWPSRTLGDWRAEKLSVQAKYRFSLAIENATYRGYTSEKILSSLLAGSIPIYWGNPLVTDDFNAARFVNCHDFESINDLVDYVLDLDSDQVALQDIVAQPLMTPTQKNRLHRIEQLTHDLVNRFLDTPTSNPRMRGSGTHPDAYLRRKRRGSRLWPPLLNRLAERICSGH